MPTGAFSHLPTAFAAGKEDSVRHGRSRYVMWSCGTAGSGPRWSQKWILRVVWRPLIECPYLYLTTGTYSSREWLLDRGTFSTMMYHTSRCARSHDTPPVVIPSSLFWLNGDLIGHTYSGKISGTLSPLLGTFMSMWILRTTSTAVSMLSSLAAIIEPF